MGGIWVVLELNQGKVGTINYGGGISGMKQRPRRDICYNVVFFKLLKSYYSKIKPSSFLPQ